MSLIRRQIDEVHKNLERVRKALGAQAQGFEQEFAQLTRDVTDGKGSRVEHEQRLSGLLEKYPGVLPAMREVPPGVFDQLPAPDQSRTDGAGAGAPAARLAAARQNPPFAAATAAVNVPANGPTMAAAQRDASTPQIPIQSGPAYVAPSEWTPQVALQFFKEIVTALIGVTVVGFTLYLALKTFGLAGNKSIADGKDILTLMMGLAGVVTGYYFGRVPADARAAQSEVQANTARAHAEQVSAKSQELLDQAEKVISSVPTRDGTTAAEADLTNLRRLRLELRGVLNAGSRR